MKGFSSILQLALMCAFMCAQRAKAAAPLVTLEYRIVGAQLQISPGALSVPKNIAGSILPALPEAIAGPLGQGAHIEATLRGPSFPARRLIGAVNQPLLLPPLNLVGDYQLDNIRLVDSNTGATRLEGTPGSIPVRVFDEVLVSRVTSRPLSLDEIRGKGIAIDEKNFRAVEFEVGFVLDGKRIPVKFPVVAPAFRESTEIIPAAELEKRLAEAEAANNELALGSELPDELRGANLNIEIKGINFQFVDEGEGGGLGLAIPPIPALMVIPGNIGYLNQFFSVQIFTENAAPAGSGLSAFNIQAHLKLPAGPDTVPASSFDAPGDDPLRFARLGPDKIVQPAQQIFHPGPDGRGGTSDDVGRLQPGESGQAEFFVEGLQEGLHLMDVDLTADLDGLAAGTVKVKGRAAGSVLVRNPKFSLAFAHPRTTRAGEPYDAFVTVLNTSSTVANLVQVKLSSASVSGGVLESDDTVELGTIRPGESATAKFRIRAQRTGAISFSNLTTSEDSILGQFRLHMGIDERGVQLSPDTVLLPDFATNLPPALLSAANRVIGQALSVATAPLLPNGVLPISKSIVTRRVLELAEAGQRVRYGDPLERVLPDLLLDWQGARLTDTGFEQIIRESDAGREWREAISREMGLADNLNAVDRLVARLPDLAGRAETWTLFALGADTGESQFTGGLRYDPPGNDAGVWFAAKPASDQVFEWRVTAAISLAQLACAQIADAGSARLLRWSVSDLPAGACVRFEANDPAGLLRVDFECDGVVDSTLAPSISTVNELPPRLLAAIQDGSVVSGRPANPCGPTFPMNYGTVLAVLFSKPMQQDLVNVPSAYTLENGNVAGSVQIQPGGRIALLNMRRPVGGIRQRTLTASGIADAHGGALVTSTVVVTNGLTSGIAIRGRVGRADGSPAIGVPVTLTMYDLVSGFDCEPYIVRPCQLFTDANGYFELDFVMSGVAYSVSATDISGLSGEALQIILDSAAGDSFNRAKLLELANNPATQNSLLASFAVGAMPEAIAKAEGLDRALLRDLIEIGSPREGTVVPVALSFRGRGAVVGRVVAADGSTPISHAAVNLFPDPDSRELGRGLFSDSDGRFAFLGVPLGTFSLQADNGAGLSRTINDVIESPGETNEVIVVLSAAVVPRTDVIGRVVEADNTTAHPGATVFLIFNRAVVAIATADANGFWRASNVPTGLYDVAAISLDGRRKGSSSVAAPSGVVNQVTIALQGFGVVIGRVETAAGVPVRNAQVAGGETLVRTDETGAFRLTGVPTGVRDISAGVERTLPGGPIKSTPAFGFPRLGSVKVNVLPGVENFGVIRFPALGSVVGRVLDETGTRPITGLNVALPGEGGFSWVPVNERGEFAFEGLPLGDHTFSAPAPPVEQTDTSGLIQKILSGSEAQVQASIGEAFAIFTGASNPLLNGEGAAFNPNRWGFAKTSLTADGEVRNIVVQFLPASSIGGIVKNSQGVPIGARLQLTGVGPLVNGAPGMIVRGTLNSDPALGTFLFDKAALVGDWGLQAASPFFPAVISTNGQTSKIDPNELDVLMQFPPTREVNGRLAGLVFNPDGSLVDAGVRVRIESMDLEIQTRADGSFDTQIALPALTSDGRPGKEYFVEAEMPGGGRGAAAVTVLPGITNLVNVTLLGRGSLRVTVLNNGGTPAGGARVQFNQGNYPSDSGELIADAAGVAIFENLFEGVYSVNATIISGPSALNGRGGISLQRGQVNLLTIVLGPTGTIEGHFVKRDRTIPIPFAQIAVGALGFTTSDETGFFRVTGLPMGTYRLTSHDPVSGIAASLISVLTFNDQINVVTLVEQSRGEVFGTVIASDAVSPAPGVNVTISFNDGILPARTVTSGPDGRFSFPGVGPGPFNLAAENPLSHLSGFNTAVMPENAARFEVNVALPPRGALVVRVLEPDGLTPATFARVELTDGDVIQGAETDATGRARFGDLSLKTYPIKAASRRPLESRSLAFADATVSAGGQVLEMTLQLLGVGTVTGQVITSDGAPVAGAEASLLHQSVRVRDVLTKIADSDGRFTFSDVALGPYLLTARSGPLGAQVSGSVSANNETRTETLTLEPSGIIKGRLVRANGATPVVGEDVRLLFPGRAKPGVLLRTDTGGLFEFNAVPLGAFRFECVALGFNGVARRDSTLTTNGETNDLGDVRMDEDDLVVTQVAPANGAVDVPVSTTVDFTFNEAVDAGSVKSNGIYLRGPAASIPATLETLSANVVRLRPNSPLKSLTTYQIVVVDGDRKDAFGAVIAEGPADLVGRPLVAPFLSSFTTADSDPPILVSRFPAPAETQIDGRSVIRLLFNEPIRVSEAAVTLTGPGGTVVGAVSAGPNNLSILFAPLAALPPNSEFALNVSNVRDIAGNRATGDPFTSVFKTLDTLGPEITSVRIADGRNAVAGAKVFVEAIMAAAEPGVAVKFTQDLNFIGQATGAAPRISVQLPASGSTTIRAIAVDALGNEGPIAEQTFVTLANQPPVITFTRIEPVTGPAPSGSTLRLNVSASDDFQVTNLTVRATGFTESLNTFPNGAVRALAFPIPLDVPEGASIHFKVTAQDFAGLESQFDLEVPLLARPLPELVLEAVEFELPEQSVTNITVNARHRDGGLARLELDGAGFSTLIWTNSNATNLLFEPAIAETNATFSIAVAAQGTKEFTIRAFATNDLPAVLLVRIIGLADLDRDGIPDRDDVDVDGDSLSNAEELVLGTDPRKRDTDGDTLADNAEIALGTNPLNTDTDGDALPDNADSNPLQPALKPVIDAIGAVEMLEQSSRQITAHITDGDANLIEAHLQSPAVSARWVANSSTAQSVPSSSSFASDFQIDASGPLTTFVSVIAVDADGQRSTNRFDVIVLADLDRDGIADRDDTDIDDDGLSNADELLAGTDPRNRDTDGDNIPDNTDPRPLVKNLAPSVDSQLTLAVTSPSNLPINVTASDPNDDPLTIRITRLPNAGRLFQTSDGVTRGAQITTANTAITHPQFKIIFAPPFAANTTVTFAAVANDAFIDSEEAIFSVVVTAVAGADSDGDSMPDSYEVANDLDPEIDDRTSDRDGDGLSNLDEFNRGLLAGNSDTDADGLNDGAELAALTDPLDPDTDDDGIRDGIDPNPLRNDSDIDGDGIADQDDPDMDNDGLSNVSEVSLGTDPRAFDTDQDGWPDGLEVEAASDPLAADSRPVLFVAGETVARIVLPAAPVLQAELLGVTVSETPVLVVLPAAPSVVLDAGSITVGEPPVMMVLPHAPALNDALLGITISEPPVGLVLPAEPSINDALLGLTVGEPIVQVVLPASPGIDSAMLGVTLSEPVVLLHLEADEEVQIASTILRSIELSNFVAAGRAKTSGPAWQVKLEWTAPDSANFTVESSADLVRWTAENAEIVHTGPRQFRGQCAGAPSGESRFYRIIQLP